MTVNGVTNTDTTPIKVYLGIPSTGQRLDFQCYVLREIEKTYKGRIELVYPSVCAQRIFHDHARSAITREFLETGCDVLWFLDSDIAPPPDVFDFFLKYYDKWSLAGLPYPVFMTPPGGKRQQAVICVYDNDGIGLKASKVPKDGVRFVDGLATGCLFIKREVLEQIPHPHFEFEYDPETRGLKVGEDLGFCLKTASLGYQYLTDFSKVCGHYKTVNLLEVVNAATEFAQTYVDEYHAQIKPVVEGLSKEIERLKKEKTPSKIQIAQPGDILGMKKNFIPHGLKI